MIQINQKGLAPLVLVSVITGIVLVSGGVAWRIYDVNSQKNNAAQQQDTASTAALESGEHQGAIDELSTEETENSSQADKPDRVVEEPTSPPATLPTPTNEPTPPIQKEPQPNYALYNSPQQDFTSLEPKTVYVVNKNGAKLGEAEAYYSTTFVKTISFGAKAEAYRQDGEGPNSMSLNYNGKQYTANPSDFRTTYPYN